MKWFEFLTQKLRRDKRQVKEFENLDHWVTIQDGNGRYKQISLHDYRDHHLIPLLKRSWDEPDALSHLISQALENDLYSEVEIYAKRLFDLEKHKSSRCVYLYTSVLIFREELEAAEKILLHYIKHQGESVDVFTNLGHLYTVKKDWEKAGTALFRAIQINPNHERALELYLKVWELKSDRLASFMVLLEASKIRGSWRPQALMVLHCIRRGKFERAQQFFDQIVEALREHPEYLQHFARELYNLKAYREIILWITPLYGVRRHSPAIGFMILDSCAQLQLYEEGHNLFKQIKMIEYPEIHESIAGYERLFKV